MGSYPFSSSAGFGTKLVVRATDPARLDEAFARLSALFG